MGNSYVSKVSKGVGERKSVPRSLHLNTLAKHKMSMDAVSLRDVTDPMLERGLGTIDKLINGLGLRRDQLPDTKIIGKDASAFNPNEVARSDGNTITLNTSIYSDKTNGIANIYSFAHEYAHQLEGQLIKMSGVKFGSAHYVEMWKNHKIADMIITKAIQSMGKKVSSNTWKLMTINAHMGNHARDNYGECFSTALSIYARLGSKSPEFVKAIVTATKESFQRMDKFRAD